ncbi:hypothetical protein QWY75_09075 [Pontixanthobacter aestiaquae]|uniref:Lipoprotein n=1 Tax=Pontixanthobacter aestiaquae TaxID=1509367 RepID=A0A844Z9V6_9SPHN|nr:hypothetical protein [Pontixanthobacter aestiaquae]MDN3646351.1 hypothetical protein [Pontixanthobacter aestiaquae]MXO82659.1 hypothetical protein [Pontixanthobacter aestiaquae]
MIGRSLLMGITAFVLAGCGGNAEPGTVTADTAEKFAGVGPGETLYFGGNEPFWGGDVTGEELRYTTPENIEGEVIAVKRFAGMGGLSLSGDLSGATFDMLVTDSPCSDTMADRDYPFTITLKIGEETRSGCGWTDAKPFTGDQNP